jgi:hypothetical protein
MGKIIIGPQQRQIPGLEGEQGEQGPPGPQGPQGEPGRDGEDGKSAFELAVERGFKGTEVGVACISRGRARREGRAGRQRRAGRPRPPRLPWRRWRSRPPGEGSTPVSTSLTRDADDRVATVTRQGGATQTIARDGNRRVC